MSTTYKHYFLVMGPPQHGKSTTANILSVRIQGRFGSTSSIVYEELAHELNTSVEALRRIPKEELRPELVRKGNDLCSINPSHLVEALIDRDFNIIDGVRRLRELKKTEVLFQELGVKLHKLWIFNPKGPTIQDNTEITEDLADHIIINSGTLAELEAKVLNLLSTLDVTSSLKVSN